MHSIEPCDTNRARDLIAVVFELLFQLLLSKAHIVMLSFGEQKLAVS